MNTLVFGLIAASVLQTQALLPTGPLFNEQDCLSEGEMFGDRDSMCWYHLCMWGPNGLRLQPMHCALGSKLSSTFTRGYYNPCTVNFDTNIGYECDRVEQAFDAPPQCAVDGSVTCYNGGILAYEADNCWCVCDPEWEGEFDCSKPTGINDAFYNDVTGVNEICPEGVPEEDYCFNFGGCDNGGTCYNQCRGFWCACPSFEEFEYVGKQCELVYKK